MVNNTTGFTSTSGENTLKIAPHDSMYVFATVDIDPNNALSPFLITGGQPSSQLPTCDLEYNKTIRGAWVTFMNQS